MKVLQPIGQFLRARGTLLLLVTSAGVNVALAQRLSLELQTPNQAGQRGLTIGQTVEPIETVGPDNKRTLLSFESATVPTLIYVMHPSCGWCVRNNANLRALVAAAGRTYRMVILSTAPEGVDEYRARYSIDAPILIASEDTVLSYKLGGTPQTILVSPQGSVQKLWGGAYSDRTADEIKTQLQVSLPGLLEPEPATGGKS